MTDLSLWCLDVPLTVVVVGVGAVWVAWYVYEHPGGGEEGRSTGG